MKKLSLRRGDSPNLHEVGIEDTTFYFSYETCVAFRNPDVGLRVHENIWSRTTGKHLNSIDRGDKGTRLPAEVFAIQLDLALLRLG